MATTKTTKAPAKKPAPEPRVPLSYISRDNWIHFIIWIVVLYALGAFLSAVTPILLPFVVGAVMAYLFDPLADRLEKRIPRGVAALLITLCFFSILVGLLAWLGPLLYHQLTQLIAKIPSLMRELEMLMREEGKPAFNALNKITNGKSDAIPNNASEMLERAFAMGGEMLLKVLASGGAVLNVLSLLLITPIVAFYLLRDWDKGVAKLNALLPRAYAKTIREQALEINRTLAGYLRGQFYVMLLLAVYYVALLSLLGLKYSLVVGVLTGLLVIVPYLGTWVSTVLALSIAYSQYGFDPAFWVVVAVYGLGQVLEQQILTPKIIGERVGLHPLWLLFGMLAGGLLLGFVGVLLAVPLTAVVSVLVRFVVNLYLRSSLYTDK